MVLHTMCQLVHHMLYYRWHCVRFWSAPSVCQGADLGALDASGNRLCGTNSITAHSVLKAVK